MNNIASGDASFDDAEVNYYDFSKTEVESTDKQKLLPATNNTSSAQTLSGTFAEVVTSSTWESYVKEGTNHYVADAAGKSNASAYLVITYSITVNTPASHNIGNYVVTLTAGAGKTSDIVLLVESGFGGVGALSTTNTFAAYDSSANTRSLAATSAAGKYSFRVIAWLNGVTVTDSTAAITAQDLLTASAAFVANS